MTAEQGPGFDFQVEKNGFELIALDETRTNKYIARVALYSRLFPYAPVLINRKRFVLLTDGYFDV